MFGKLCAMVETTVIRAETTATTLAPSAQYARMRGGEITLLTNFYGSIFGGLGPSDYVQWDARVEGNEGTGNNGWRNREKILEATLRYILRNNDNYHVKAYPVAFIGTLSEGRSESTGFIRGMLEQVATIPANIKRMSGTNLESPVYDMEVTKALTGFPCRADQVPATKVRFKITRNTSGIENGFIDLYYGDVNDTNVYNVPTDAGNFSTIRVPHVDLAGTVNGLNVHRTRAWNVNLWPFKPVETNSGSTRVDGGWAGGQVLTDIGQTIIDGRDHHVVFKRESQGTIDEFDYIGLIFKDEEFEGEIDISAYNDWVLNQAWGVIQSSPIAMSIFNASRVKPWGAPRQPAGDMIFANVSFGFEAWKSQDNDQEASLTIQQLEFDVAGKGVFGWGPNAKVDTTDKGNDLKFSDVIKTGESIIIPADQINDSGSAVVSYEDTDSKVTSVIALDPFELRVDAEGVNTITATLANGGTGTITITGARASNVKPDYGVRTLAPGQTKRIDVSKLPGVSSLTVRRLLSSNGPFDFTYNDPILTVTAATSAADKATGIATVGNNGN